MAVFYNRATLSYNDSSTNSNIVTGEIREAVTAVKTAVTDTYENGDDVTYVISLVNSGSTSLNGLTVTDNLGSYTFNGNTLYPLTYIQNSLKYYVNGVLQASPTISSTSPLIITGISIPANGNTVLVYEADVNSYAPIGPNGSITNTGSVTGDDLITPIPFTETIQAIQGVNLSITKSLSPEVIVNNGEITYTFTILNTGSEAALATDNLVITDLFNPILDITSVVYNGTAWTSPDNYTYNETTGLFQTVAGQITVPGATFTQDPTTGIWNTVPGSATLTVTGTI